MSKFQISVIDFMAEIGKHMIGEKDSEGNEIFAGDIVEYGGDKHLIAQR